MGKTNLRPLILGVIAVTGPAMLALDFLLRQIFMGTEPAEVRAFFADRVTPIAWCFVPLPVLGGIGGFFWYPKRLRVALDRWRRDTTLSAEVAAERADFEALFLSTTLAQVPAILGDLSLILGARPAPALACTAASVTAILLIGALSHKKFGAPDIR